MRRTGVVIGILVAMAACGPGDSEPETPTACSKALDYAGQSFEINEDLAQLLAETTSNAARTIEALSQGDIQTASRFAAGQSTVTERVSALKDEVTGLREDFDRASETCEAK